MSGQNVGAGKPDRVARTNYFAAITMFGVLSVVAVVVWLFPRPIVAAFTTDPDVIEVGTAFIRIVAPTFGFIGIMRAFNGGFRGTGHTLIAAAIALLTLGGVRLPIAWVGANLIGPTGIWYAFAVSTSPGPRSRWRGFVARAGAGARRPRRETPLRNWSRTRTTTDLYKCLIGKGYQLPRTL
jgi:Na+-driven multidrug efflux pump